jgi:hypothetical protein
MVLHRSVLKENILCEFYADTCSDVSNDSDNEIVDSDSDVPTTSLHKQLRPSAVVFSSDSETSTVVKKIGNRRALMIQVMCVCKTDKPSNEPFLGSTGLNIIINNPESVVEVVSSVIGADLIPLLSEQSNLYHSQIAQKWKFLPKTLKWSHITPEEMRNF